MKNFSRLLCLLFLLIHIAACAHYPLNERSTTFDKESGYRFAALERGPKNSDELFVCLLFSGGGTRAAALSYGIMKELRETPIRVGGEEKTLLDEVDCISSVSGGSFTAAYYGLFRGRLFEDFKKRFLDRNIQGALALRIINPYHLIRVMSPDYGRIDMTAELYDEDIYDSSTFSDLQDKGRPFVILNATNMGPGRRFYFTQENFDAVGSRLDQYKVSRAVAASSAFPFLLSAITLNNYPVATGYEPPWFYKNTLESQDWTSRRYDAAMNLAFYLDKDNRYIHLMDGGLSDNIGAQAVLDAYEHGFIRKLINEGAIRRLVVIIVNARTESEDELSKEASPPGLMAVAGKTATVAMDNYSFESVERMRSTLYERVQTQKNMNECRRLLKKYCENAPEPFLFPVEIDPYVVEVNFKAVNEIPGEDPRYYLDLPTSFKLSEEQVKRLIGIGPKLLRAAPMFQCLLKVLEAEAEGLPRPEDCPVGAGIAGN